MASSKLVSFANVSCFFLLIAKSKLAFYAFFWLFSFFNSNSSKHTSRDGFSRCYCQCTRERSFPLFLFLKVLLPFHVRTFHFFTNSFWTGSRRGSFRTNFSTAFLLCIRRYCLIDWIALMFRSSSVTSSHWDLMSSCERISLPIWSAYDCFFWFSYFFLFFLRVFSDFLLDITFFIVI